ncbi:MULTISPECIES: hypothetical protein [unclassified Bartonella]|uniref:hypothetical protein n=1 Tax=unclassified Bartonella TaxID=2645622 RepID=UPI00235DC5DA|nr:MULTISPECIES: hypothetical protein [unclassified Bartonella]
MRGRSQPVGGEMQSKNPQNNILIGKKLLQELSSFLLPILSNYFMNQKVFWSHTRRSIGIKSLKTQT